MNKRGWIRIVEAFVAILLIAGVLLIVINKGYFGKQDISERVYDIEISILREIELSDALRQDILDIDKNKLPIEGERIERESTLFPKDVKDKIDNELLNYPYLECKEKICKMDVICALDEYPTDKDVYAQSVAITATLQDYSPRQLKLFCWVK